MKGFLVLFALGFVVHSVNAGSSKTCESFELPPPAESVGEAYDGYGDLQTDGRILWTETYCRKSDLGSAKFCVKNYRTTIAGRQCIRASVQNVPKASVKRIKIGVHPDCKSVPYDGSKFQVYADKSTKPSGLADNVLLCFKDIPASEPCCDTTRCLVIEAVIDVGGDEKKMKIDDDRCSGRRCDLQITCPNLITTPSRTSEDDSYAYFYGSDEDDVFYVGGSGATETNYISAAEGDDFVFGSSVRDYVLGGGGDDTFYGFGGDDDFTPGDGKDRFWGKSGDDYVWLPVDGDKDLIYGGSGTNIFYSPDDDQVDENDRFKDFVQATN
uniref:Uncharacterized protein n=1 Tax=Rhodosorus marinus TaxID=101924 RepID=A0A7S3EGS2_9RHOD|mmetsp:Transcript_32843/g.129005  ORF Transcript_32843/g.129005 Transcript_32843/m.129005 type:complete len:326 (+) Transcript_32843:502-1479(+)|eukprot:CAMPEP_0113964734 /NCGR_PEP_ID=MMETSP0011_2-20120614/7323_1 /TAXON_ID=101924 /ORGANISM="Rhodosorus marinus" /LENGTH=325 /DNA_ID=CAMNT_0000977107 /DNA_START=204 /DNA_END=1181 /DNA_ORIENTATION=- /assembly_acc=CAM_ASM_000156